MKKFALFLILPLIVMFPKEVSAHAAHALQQFSNESVVILNYNVDHFDSGLPVKFIVQLLTLDGGRYVDFDEANITVKRFGVEQHSTTVKKGSNEDAVFDYTYPEGGTYSTEVEMVKNGKVIADATFSHRVDEWQNQSFTDFLLGNKMKVILAFVVLCIGAYILGSIRVHHPLFYHVKKLRKKKTE